MKLTTQELLLRLGAGERIAALCTEAGISQAEFDAWWEKETKSRLPPVTGNKKARVSSRVRIERDGLGIPKICAERDEDLFFGFGYAMAQDRLFQLDYLRRRGLGRLSEILGPSGMELDLIARTVGLNRIAEAEWKTLPEETRRLTQAFSDGINQLIEDSRGNLPIEFSLLGYEPHAWSPVDSLAIEGEFRWYLTGRFPVICIPELAKRALGPGKLYEAFLLGEIEGEAILPAGSYPTRAAGNQPLAKQPVGKSVGDPQGDQGSNNWVISGKLSASGKPLLASDPHIAITAVSVWYQVQLSGGSFNVAGIAYAGMPAVMFGRNPRVAWGITNNICSQRDVYQEQTDTAHPGCFLYDGRWEPGREIQEEIKVKGGEAVRKTIRFSRNGPIVDEILPAAAKGTGPASLKWLGMFPCGWLTALLQMDRAKNVSELREAMRPWQVPTFSLVLADVEGRIGYQCAGRIPIRNHWERGYRPGWDPKHQWDGLIPFEGMPRVDDPAQGFVATANHRVAADDFAYPLSGTWNCGYRGLRIRKMLTEKKGLTREDFAAIQLDALSLRGVECVPLLLSILKTSPDAKVKAAVEELRKWDCHMEPDRVGAALFHVFFARWSQRVAEQRFDQATAEFIGPAIPGLAVKLLSGDDLGWFPKKNCAAAVQQVFAETLDWLAEKLGPEMSGWTWGKLHQLELRHFLSGRGDLGQLLDRGRIPVKGDGYTVCNTGSDPSFISMSGAGYRLISDLSDPNAGMWAIDASSESGHPGSPHYDDQLSTWNAGGYHYRPLLGAAAAEGKPSVLVLEP